MSAEFAGGLNERISIDRLLQDRTEGGLSTSVWCRVLDCRAAVVPEGLGSEAEGMAFSGMPRVRFTIRPSNIVAVQQRVVWRSRTFVVRQVYEDPRQADRVELRCEEVRS